MQYAVEIKNVTLKLSKDFAAIKDVSANIPQGKITGFIGPSGAGKTTLIRAIVGRQQIAKGVIEVLSHPAGSASLRNDVTYMTQSLSVYSDLTVRENLRYFAQMAGVSRKTLNAETESVLQAVDMIEHKNSLVEVLSGGQKQRVSLAISLIAKPKLLVLDEPTVGLDPVLREHLWNLFRTLTQQGSTIVLTSHVMDEASRCDELLLIRDGCILAHDSPQKICEGTGSDTVEQAFIKLVGAST